MESDPNKASEQLSGAGERTKDHPFAFILGVAVASCIASVLIALIALTHLNYISEAGMWAIALMVAAPSAMGFGIASLMCKSQPRE